MYRQQESVPLGLIFVSLASLIWERVSVGTPSSVDLSHQTHLPHRGLTAFVLECYSRMFVERLSSEGGRVSFYCHWQLCLLLGMEELASPHAGFLLRASTRPLAPAASKKVLRSNPGRSLTPSASFSDPTTSERRQLVAGQPSRTLHSSSE